MTGRIAENHLTPQARTAVYSLLGDQALPDVASWADELRNDPEYKNTASWHFINLPLGLDRQDFENKIKGLGPGNVYGAILKCEADLKDAGTTPGQKTDALKFLVHFIGDIHQPMHISRAEDKGGNTIQVNYDGKGTNLHSLWDTKMLEHESTDPVQLTQLIDKASPEEIQRWQIDPIKQYWPFTNNIRKSLNKISEDGANLYRCLVDNFRNSRVFDEINMIGYCGGNLSETSLQQ